MASFMSDYNSAVRRDPIPTTPSIGGVADNNPGGNGTYRGLGMDLPGEQVAVQAPGKTAAPVRSYAVGQQSRNTNTTPVAEPEPQVDYSGYYQASPALSYDVPRLPGATSQEAYINAMYDANRKAQEDALRSAYEQNVVTINDQLNRLPSAYSAAANQVAAQAAIQRQNMNEQMAASGLNSGAGTQAALAHSNAYLSNIREVRQAQADAQANLELQRVQMETQYKNAIAEAIAQNDLQRAQALYQEALRVDESIQNTALNQANLDWTVWNSLYNK